MTESYKLLVAGDGRGHSTAVKYSAIILAATMALSVFSFWLAGELGYTNTPITSFFGGATSRRNDLWYVFIVISIGSLVLGVWDAAHIYNRIAGTHISVYTHEIKGIGLDPGFLFAWSKKHLNFKLSYNQISAVDVAEGNILDIHTSGSKYRCFVPNAEAMRDAIMELKKFDRQRNSQ